MSRRVTISSTDSLDSLNMVNSACILEEIKPNTNVSVTDLKVGERSGREAHGEWSGERVELRVDNVQGEGSNACSEVSRIFWD